MYPRKPSVKTESSVSSTAVTKTRQHDDILFDISPELSLLDKLVSAVWLYDIENYCILWANKAGLAHWESDCLN